jgi:hypothetical protein
VFVRRATKKLLGRLPPGLEAKNDEHLVSDSRLGDWTAHLFFIGRQQLVLGVNTTGRCSPCCCPARPTRRWSRASWGLRARF